MAWNGLVYSMPLNSKESLAIRLKSQKWKAIAYYAPIVRLLSQSVLTLKSKMKRAIMLIDTAALRITSSFMPQFCGHNAGVWVQFSGTVLMNALFHGVALVHIFFIPSAWWACICTLYYVSSLCVSGWRLFCFSCKLCVYFFWFSTCMAVSLFIAFNVLHVMQPIHTR